MPEWLGGLLAVAVIFGGGFVWVAIRDKISERAASDRKRRLGETEQQ